MNKKDFDEFPTIPTRYAFDEESSDEDIAEVVDKLDLDTVKVDLVENGDYSGRTVIFGVYGPGEVFLKASYGLGEEAGKIYTKDKTLASIFTWQQDAKALVIISEEKLPDEIAFTLVQALFQTLSDIKQFIILDSYLASNYISSNRTEREAVPNLKCLRSSTDVKSLKIELLSPPNLSTGITAAILTHCEIHQIPCVALFALQESSLGKTLITDETTEGYASTLTNMDVSGALVDNDSLHKILRARKYGKDSGRIDADHHRMYI
ncbi:unnamed protein product [Umbelopsis vinacea]